MENVRNITDSPRQGKKRTSFVIPQHWEDYVDKEAAQQGTSKSQIYLRALAVYKEQHEGGASSWDTVDGYDDYDPHAFYTASQDKKGHSFHLRMNIPKPLAAECIALVQSGKIPQFRSIEDIGRNGLYHHVKQIAIAYDEGMLEEAVDMAMALADEIAIQDREEEAAQFVAAVESNIDRLVRRADWSALRRYLTEREKYIDSIPAPWSEHLEDAIKGARKKVARAVKKATR